LELLKAGGQGQSSASREPSYPSAWDEVNFKCVPLQEGEDLGSAEVRITDVSIFENISPTTTFPRLMKALENHRPFPIRSGFETSICGKHKKYSPQVVDQFYQFFHGM
jgi:hypothetical protein